MALWKFFDYVTADSQNLIRSWYESQDKAVQAQFDVTLLILGGMEDWEDETALEFFKPLVNKHLGLGEIRFYIDERPIGAKKPRRRRFRPVGIWPTALEHEFILILGCEETRMTYIPVAAFDMALLHKTELEKGRGSIHEHA
jgi:hypothetical protein